MKLQSTLTTAVVISAASAHTIFVQLAAGGVTNPASYGVRTPTYDGPINDVLSNDVVCNGGPNPTKSSDKVIDVKAGETVKATWRHGSADVIDPSHKGPVMAYMKKVTDATTDSGVGAGWFKISEAGLNTATGKWAVDDLIASNGIQSITIPTCIENGQYLLRAEIIALHNAGSTAGAQFYMECAQINVSGGTASSKPATVSLPGAYSPTDPGILINIYQTLTGYKIPGPAPFTCGAGGGGGGGGGSPTTQPPSTPTTMVTSKVATSTKASSTTPASPGGTVPLYGQCGGLGWTGATVCASGTCKSNGAYYSQCAP
ncbi:related to endoglucanase B [Rhynchosporium agropyri]|uniref:AA9 family lytic polysaccharide monooxygenase n=1 Tax=Rhynchosporium agropyri TaxID=914238 RepID=A0A1E1KLK8_9HELO|nr:related to endoglucanase B [Rhynchosporium agropyri]